MQSQVRVQTVLSLAYQNCAWRLWEVRLLIQEQVVTDDDGIRRKYTLSRSAADNVFEGDAHYPVQVLALELLASSM